MLLPIGKKSWRGLDEAEITVFLKILERTEELCNCGWNKAYNANSNGGVYYVSKRLLILL